MPRHPPCALTNLATKMLASTVQFSKYGRTNHHNHRVPQPDPHDPAEAVRCDDCPTTIICHEGPPHPSRGARSLRTQQCAQTTTPPATDFPHPITRRYSPVPHETTRPCQRSTQLSNHPETPARDMALGTHQPNRASSCQRLLRKEVIQPHLPVRLPCYDFVPIASPTFDGSLPKGLGHRLRVLPTFVT